MPNKNRTYVRLLLFCILPFLAGCEESSIPVIPEGEPRFTGLVINRLEAAPHPDASVRPGDLQYSVTAYYQIGPNWAGEAFQLWLAVESWSNDEFLRVERWEMLPLTDVSGTVRFTGTVTVPNCGAIDELLFFTGLWAADDTPDYWIDRDWYLIDVTNTSSTPC